MKYELRLLALFGWVGYVAAGCQGGDPLAPPTGPCGPTPRLLVSAANYWPGHASDGTGYLAGFALDGPDLYYSAVRATAQLAIRPGALMHVSKSGGATTQLADGYEFQIPIVTPTSVVVGVLDESSYAGGILSVPRRGGAATPIATFNDEIFRTPQVTDGISVYFVDNAGVQSVPLAAGAAPASPTQVAAGLRNGLAVFGQRLLLLAEGTITEIPIGSSGAGTETNLGHGPPGELPGSLLPCGANACWLTTDAVGDNVVEQIDLTSGAVSTVASAPRDSAANSRFFAFDGTNFFILVVSDSAPPGATIQRFSGVGAAPVIVANLSPSYLNTGGLAVDDACVYFTTAAGLYSLSSSAEGVSVE
jgi:hypothetical protein